MARTVELIYNNTGPASPSGQTPNQGVASVASVGIYSSSSGTQAVAPGASDPYAKLVIQSNGENIGNAQIPSNPLPKGL